MKNLTNNSPFFKPKARPLLAFVIISNPYWKNEKMLSNRLETKSVRKKNYKSCTTRCVTGVQIFGSIIIFLFLGILKGCRGVVVNWHGRKHFFWISGFHPGDRSSIPIQGTFYVANFYFVLIYLSRIKNESSF